MKIEIAIFRDQEAQKFLTEIICAKACTITDLTLLQTPEEINRLSQLFSAATHYIQQYSKSVTRTVVAVNGFPVVFEQNENCIKQAPHLWRKVLAYIYELEASI